MSVDPWSWGDETSDQDRNNGWSSQDFQQNSKNVIGYGTNATGFGGNNNSQQPIGPPSGHHNNQRSSVWPQLVPQTNITADYFSSKAPPLNNNPFPDVENKEIAPPDHHHATGQRQPMKLGNKHSSLPQHSVSRQRQEDSGNFSNIQQAPPFSKSQHPMNHHQPPPPSYPSQNIQHNPSRNQTHHYFSNSQQDIFQTDLQSGNSWSYFDQMSGVPPQPLAQQPQSLPPDSFQDNQSQNQPKNISYFHMQDPKHPVDNNPTTAYGDQSKSISHHEVPTHYRSGEPSESQKPSPSLIPEKTLHHPKISDSYQQEFQPPTGYINHSEQSIPPLSSSKFPYQNYEEQFQPLANQVFNTEPPNPESQNLLSTSTHEERMSVQGQESTLLQGFADPDRPRRPEQDLTSLPPPSSGTDNERQAPEKTMAPPPQVPEQETARSQGRDRQGPPSNERSVAPPQVETERDGSQGRDWPPPQPTHSEKASSQERAMPPPPSARIESQPVTLIERPPSQGKESSSHSQNPENRLSQPPPPERPSSREWPYIQSDRSSSQGRDWPNTKPPKQPDRPGPQSLDKSSHQIDRHNSQGRDWVHSQPQPDWSNPTPQQQADRSSHQGLDWPPQVPQQTERSNSHSKWSGAPLSDRPGSQGREWPGPFNTERNGAQDKMGHHRTPSQGSDRSGSVGRGSVSRSDRSEVVANRSPGAGEDRTSPPTRPDNMESLPPDSHITQQLNQLSLQSSDKMGDCPLDRNEYLETSQLSNQESAVNDARSLRHQPSESSRSSHRGERREVVGEAEPLGGRVVLGHTTPTTTPPPNHSDEVEGGGSGSMERMVVGERREQSSRSNRSTRHRNHHRRESSFEEDDQDYSSDNHRGHRDDYSRREDRHRKKRGQDHRSPEYMSDEDYEIDRRVYSRRDRRGRDRDYSPEYRRDRDYYREDIRRGGRGTRDYRDYRYDDDDYSFRERSRPSSRSGSDYRRTNLDYNSRNQSRHYFNPSLAGVLGGREYETNPEYFELLRKSNPVLYAYWYQDYMRKLQDTATHSAFTQSDRASIHSGQSSGNRMHISTPNQVLESNVGNVDSFEDYSPRLFSTPHVRGCFDGLGRLLVVNACSPLDGQQASVQLLSIESENEDPAVQEFLESPGPFIPGVTHRSTVLQYLKKMSDQADRGSEKLLYDLVHLIVKSNGKPDANDISELLLESYRSSKGDMRDPWEPDPTIPQPISHQDMLSKFRSLLHQGNKQEALDWAMKHGGWGHALFLASKMDARTQNRVAGEFARSLSPSDPLSTLYQVMSGNVPAAATACSDRRWADWRPHLAMVLSNLTEKQSTDLTSVTTLADGLACRGHTHAAHSCYLIAQVMFGNLYKGEGPALLGWFEPTPLQPPGYAQSLPSVESFSYRSFLLTLCYEYAIKQGQPNFYIPALQRFKLLIAWRLVEWGRGREALLYCELLASELLQATPEPRQSNQCADLIHLLIELSSSLKALDPLAPTSAVDLSTSPDPDWLQRLKALSQTLPQEELNQPSMLTHTQPESQSYSSFEPPQHVPLYHTGGGIDGGFNNQMRVEEPPMIPPSELIEPPVSSSTPSKPVAEFHSSTQPLTHPVPTSLPSHIQPPLQQPNSLPPISAPLSYQQPAFSSQPPSLTSYDEGGVSEIDHATDAGALVKPAPWEAEHQPETSLQAQTKSSTNFFRASENLLQGVGNASSKPPQQPISDNKKKSDLDGGTSSGGGGWFGGIFGKLSMKPKNRMVLPDDNDKKIIFDNERKMWVDRDNEGSDPVKELKPPPMSNPSLASKPPVNPSMHPGNPSLPPGSNSILPQGSAPPSSDMTNKYKLQKGKSMKSNYVDILSRTGNSSKVSGNMESLIPQTSAPHPDASNPNYFMPQPVENLDSSKGNFGTHHPGDTSYQGQLSRSSSMSSLSREVQHYMDRPRHHPQSSHHYNKVSAHPIPIFYNPTNFKT